MFAQTRCLLNFCCSRNLCFVSRMHTRPKPRDLPKNLNVAKLIGVVSSDIFTTLDNKSRVFHLRTFNQDGFYDNHKIVVSPNAIENLPGLPKTGQKVFVSGKLRTQKFIQTNGKMGASIHIMAKQIYLCQSDDTNNAEIQIATVEVPEIKSIGNATKIEMKDQNQIDLMANICFDILNEDNHSVFSLALHYLSKNSDGIVEEKTDFVTVFVYNETLRNIVRNQLNRLDRVRIEGSLKYKTCVDHDGKKRYRGHIEATKIAKLITFRQAAESSTQVDSVREQAIKR